MGASASKLRTFAVEQPHAAAAGAFLSWLTAHMAVRALTARKDAHEDEVVRVRDKDGTHKVFVKRGGTKVDLGWTGAAEYWFPTLVQVIELVAMLRLGGSFFASRPGSQVGAWPRFRNIMWAVFALVPLLDLAAPEDWANPTKEDQKEHKSLTAKFRLPLYLWAVLELATTAKTIAAIVDKRNRMTSLDVVGALGTLMILNGIGINVSHELIHKQSKLEKLLGYALLMNVNYVHWGAEHLVGHHDKVATPEDPASARLNEPFYTFLPRTLVGGWLSAWHIEGPARMLANLVVPLAWGSLIAKASGGGMRALKLFYLQGLGSALLLEMVNYVEHYGLSRKKLSNGKYEACDPTHSWNAPHRLSNAFLHKLQRHSDHHTFAMRPYHLLRNFDESPQLPSGYPGMLVLALFPPVFRWIMNPLVRAAALRRANQAAVAASAKGGDTPAASDEEDFEPWVEAQRVASAKMTAFSAAFFGVSTALLARSVNAHRAVQAI